MPKLTPAPCLPLALLLTALLAACGQTPPAASGTPTNSISTPSPTPAPAPTPSPSGSSDFHIDLSFPDASLTASQKQVFQDAAARWAQVITAALPSASAKLPSGQSVTTTGVAIEASATPMDGVGKVLGQSGPTHVRSSDNLPITGLMQFDSADMASMEQNGSLKGVILHEMGHVLGIGTLWENDKLLSFTSSDGTCDNSTGAISYTGAHALAAYQALGGKGNLSVETTGGAGTKCGHWSESVFQTELMTGWINSVMPLSTITVGSLEDLGYTVNNAAADAYKIPSGLNVQSASGPALHFLRPAHSVVSGQ